MTMRTVISVSLVALALVAAPNVRAQTWSLDLEAGYQWVDVSGNLDMYRTQINQDDGIVLRNLNINFIDPESESFIDRLTLDASGFGGEPTGRFRLETGLGRSYRLRLDYRRAQTFSALPGFANPLVDDGVFPGQHTWGRDREMFDLEIELFPGSSISPVVGYRWNRLDGPRTTTYSMGQDEFRLDSNLEETEEEFYVGATFELGKFVGSLFQGWRDFEGREQSTLAADGLSGNNTRPVIGHDIEADTIDRRAGVSAETPVTTFHVAGPLCDVVSLRASYVRADAESDSTLTEMASGTLASFRIGRFFEGFNHSVSSRNEDPSWRGNLDLGFRLTDNLTFDVGFEKAAQTLRGWSLISNMYLDTTTFGGLGRGDVEELLQISNSGRREDRRFDTRLNVSVTDTLHLWLETAQTETDLDLVQDAAEIVLPESQDGTFNRSITAVAFGIAFDIGDARLSFDAETEDADRVVMRTDFTDRVRLRARFKIPFLDVFSLGATFENLTTENVDAGIGYSGETRHYSFDLGFTPSETTNFHLIWDTVDAHSGVMVRRPHDYGIEESVYAEEATVFEAMMNLSYDRFGITAGYSTLENEGSFELELDRAYARVWINLTDDFSASVEFESHDYSEAIFTVADFESERIGLFFRYRR